MMGAYNEDTNFVNPSRIPRQDPSLHYSFTPRPDGGYRVELGMDKLQLARHQNMITTVCFGDNWDIHSHLANPDLSKPLYLLLRVRLTNAEGIPDDILGEPRMRVLIGAAYTWKEKNHFMEVNLWRTESFDYCFVDRHQGGGSDPVIPCDPDGYYDRRSQWESGEQVVYAGRALEKITGTSLPPSSPEHPSWIEYCLPIDVLIRHYPWRELPEAWNQARCNGFYIGLELYGRATMNMEIEDYRLIGLR